jgi:hypothetical protein
MHEIRLFEEVAIDKALYLVLADLVTHRKSSTDVPIGDRLKCMKLPFLAEYPMFERRMKAFSFTFFKYEYGPMSKNVYEAWGDLQAVGCLQFTDNLRLKLTETGHSIAHAFIEEVLSQGKNRAFLDMLQATADEYGRLATPAILSRVYRMEVYIPELNQRLKIQDAPMGVNFTFALDDDEVEQKMSVDSGWLETLAIELNPRNKHSVTDALADYRLGRVLSHDQVWDPV